MPPKKQDNKPKKDKSKMVDDKTFGLKNKNKSTKVSKYVQNVMEQAEKAGDRKTLKAKEDEKARIQAKKDAEARKREELNELFKPIEVVQKVPFGTDPKTVLCAFFKAGTCKKGAKCKFSHNLEADRKGAKKDLYTDDRKNEEDTMESWDQTKLEEVVLSKHGNPRTTTDIVCKFFLEAIENQKYGWFWECPNGLKDCKYRHALPPGFVLKSKKQDEVKEEFTLEEFLETERHKLGSNLTPITLESFTQWKKNRQAKQDAEAEAARKTKETAVKAGKNLNLSGREFFEYNPDWEQFAFYDEDDAAFDFGGLTDHRQQNDDQSDDQSDDVPAVENLKIEA